ncbi:MAG: sulfur carrier protein ThiS [Gemmataceae bacterium]|nr:sulfur carrier protein ThiS [Gemmataceae bacterium]
MEIVLNGRPHSIDDGLSVAALVQHLGLADRHVAVEVNLEVVPRRQHASHRLAPGDRVEVVTLVGGG